MESQDDSAKPSLPLTVDSPIWWAEELVEQKALKGFYRERSILCFICPAAEAETFKQGAAVHGSGKHDAFDADKLVEALNELAGKHPFDPETVEYDSLFRRLIGLIFPSESKD